jgi:predicted amidohydrolase
MKVATVQFASTFGDRQGNLRKMASLVIQAAENDAQLIVLPELATTGYSFMSRAEAEPHAEILLSLPSDDLAPNHSLQVMFALASKFKVHIAWGMVEKDLGTGDLYNTQVLMTPSGAYESYRKVNLWGNDFLWAREGRANPPVMTCDFDGVSKKIGLLICRDVRDKKDDAWSSFYERGDADIVAFSAAWGDGGFPAVAWMDFAKDNSVTLIVSNRYGEEGPKPNKFGGGGVCVVERNGKVHCDGLLWNQDCVVYADVP